MKDKIKKLLASLAALVMAVGLMIGGSVPVMAETVSNDTNHSYDVYQIFSGTQSSTAGSTQLGDIEWGTGIKDSTSDKSSELITALKANTAFGSGADNAFYNAANAQDVATALEGKADKSDFANAFANEVAKHLTTTKTTLASNATTSTLTPGYYLFVDSETFASGSKDVAYNSALLQITNKTDGLKIEAKYDVPTPAKTIEKVEAQSTNDDSTTAGLVLTETDSSSEKDSAVAEIGDIVTFHLSAKLPTNLEDYDSYKFEFEDTLSNGLEYVSGQTPTVKIGDDVADSTKYTVTAPTTANSNKFTITWTNIKSDANAAKDKVVSVDYTAKVTSAATTGYSGNTNTVVLNYSNNPNGTGEGTSTSKEVKVYTFDLKVKKTKQDNTGLGGAGFVLKNSAGKFYAYDSTNNIVKWVDDVTNATQLYSHEDGNLYASVDTSDTTQKHFNGLAEGNYTLHEQTVPSGYNSASDISFTINAVAQGSGNNAITLENTAGATIDTNGDYNITVVNNAGSILPSTGGIGTTIFYVAGGILIIGAAVLLIARRKRNA